MNHKEYDRIKRQCDILSNLSDNLKVVGNTELANVVNRISENIEFFARESLSRENKSISGYADMSIKNSMLKLD